jgi:enoyl-CoA hydratase/carnithine racemase
VSRGQPEADVNGAPITYEKSSDGLVAWVTLNRPQVLNAINMEMRDLLWEALHAAEGDPDVRGVIFKGAGDRAFSAGADISEFGTAPSFTEARRARRERDLWGFMLGMSKLLVAAIHGYALGAGIELPMCCDLRLASEDARLGLPEVSLGYIPSAGGTQTLPRHLPRALAIQMVLTGDPIDAQKALRHGLVHRVVPRARLYAEAEEWTRHAATRPAAFVAAAKRAIREGIDIPLGHALALDAALARQLLATGSASLPPYGRRVEGA